MSALDTLVIALRVSAVSLVLTCALYPLVVTGAGQILFPAQAAGSFVADEHGNVVGSELLGQGFAHPAYFHSRPSAAGAGWDAAASSGSNLGPTSQKLHDRLAAAVEAEVSANPDGPGPVPAELITTSASGLDPHVSPAGARWQVPRIAAARGVSRDRIQTVVDAYTEGRTLGILGEPRVNVLLLNLALDRQFGKPTPVPAAIQVTEAVQ
jgi:potassium-transporting ATPase KdpC subunit